MALIIISLLIGYYLTLLIIEKITNIRGFALMVFFGTIGLGFVIFFLAVLYTILKLM